MQLKTKLIYSTFIAVALLIFSIIFPLIPCTISPNIPNADSSWSVCSLNPDTTTFSNEIIKYFGYAQQLTTSYFIVLIFSFSIAMLIFYLLTRSKW